MCVERKNASIIPHVIPLSFHSLLQSHSKCSYIRLIVSIITIYERSYLLLTHYPPLLPHHLPPNNPPRNPPNLAPPPPSPLPSFLKSLRIHRLVTSTSFNCHSVGTTFIPRGSRAMSS